MMEDLILKFLDNGQLLALFEQVTYDRLVVTWPPAPNDEAEKARLNQLHAQLLSVGFDRRLGSELKDRDLSVRTRLSQLRQQTGGILIEKEKP